jgi:hypothetical protein
MKQAILHILYNTTSWQSNFDVFVSLHIFELCHIFKEFNYIYILFSINPSCILVTSRTTFNLIYSASNRASVFCVTDVSAQPVINTGQRQACLTNPPGLSGFGGLVVSMLASGTQDRRFAPGRRRRKKS